MKIGYGISQVIQLSEKWVSNAHWYFNREYFEVYFTFKSKRIQRLLKNGSIVKIYKDKKLDYDMPIDDFSHMFRYDRVAILEHLHAKQKIDIWETKNGDKVYTSPVYYPLMARFDAWYTGRNKHIMFYDAGTHIGGLMPMEDCND